MLANRLQFELVDDSNLEERRAIMEKRVIANVAKMAERFYKISYLNVEVRFFKWKYNRTRKK